MNANGITVTVETGAAWPGGPLSLANPLNVWNVRTGSPIYSSRFGSGLNRNA